MGSSDDTGEAPFVEPVRVPEEFATGVSLDIVGGLAHIVYWQDQMEGWPRRPVRVVIRRIVMEAWRLEGCGRQYSCVRGDCMNRVRPIALNED
jgi:hypothetical protein